jgi:hypothetical protein
MSEGLERSRAASNMLTNVGTAAQDMVGPPGVDGGRDTTTSQGRRPDRLCTRRNNKIWTISPRPVGGSSDNVRYGIRRRLQGQASKQASSLKLAQTLHFVIGKRPINTLYPFRLSVPIRFVCSVHKRIDANLPGRWKWSGV